MNLIKSGFFKRTFCYRVGANGPTQQAAGYGYESAGKLYDVNLYAEGVQYRVNGLTTPRGPVHAAIEQFYGLTREEC